MSYILIKWYPLMLARRHFHGSSLSKVPFTLQRVQVHVHNYYANSKIFFGKTFLDIWDASEFQLTWNVICKTFLLENLPNYRIAKFWSIIMNYCHSCTEHCIICIINYLFIFPTGNMSIKLLQLECRPNFLQTASTEVKNMSGLLLICTWVYCMP